MSIQTAVVGSYPLPDWLHAYPTAPHHQDAVLVVIQTQEGAGIEVITEGASRARPRWGACGKAECGR